ncbi:MAG: kelch repeat-containing protein, partial [Actinomycetota bacterium]
MAQPLMAGAAASAAGDAEWVQVGSYTPPFIRMNAAMAFDSNSGETLLFGGNVPSNVNGNGLMGDTWTFDGSRWTEHQPAPSPSLRTGARAVWDATRGQVVLFGGAGTGGVLSDTWTWDGNTWTERHPAHSPAARAFGGMAYDAATSKVVLVGGTDGNNVSLPDTWTWDGTDWTQEITALSPPPRASFGFADGSATSPPVLFGGVNFAGVQGLYLNDTWTWDGPNHTWVPHPVATSPVPRAGLQLAYDPAIGKTVLYGGYAFAPNVQPNGFSTQGNYDDTWTWDGSGWTLLGSAGPPRQRFYGAMV